MNCKFQGKVAPVHEHLSHRSAPHLPFFASMIPIIALFINTAMKRNAEVVHYHSNTRIPALAVSNYLKADEWRKQNIISKDNWSFSLLSLIQVNSKS